MISDSGTIHYILLLVLVALYPTDALPAAYAKIARIKADLLDRLSFTALTSVEVAHGYQARTSLVACKQDSVFWYLELDSSIYLADCFASRAVENDDDRTTIAWR